MLEESDSAKSRRIQEIRNEGISPIIRVIARGLTESQALLVEKTLLWKLGKLTTNVATGHFSENFRPPNTLHRILSGFDYQNAIYYYNVGDSEHRNWDDYVKFGFISAGQGPRWRDAMLGFNPGDVCAACLKGQGFVGIGKIKTKAAMIRDVIVDGQPFLSLPLTCPSMSDNSSDPELSEYVCLVDWIRTVPRSQARWHSTRKLYTTTHVRASLDRQPQTVKFLEAEFDINLRELIA